MVLSVLVLVALGLLLWPKESSEGLREHIPKRRVSTTGLLLPLEKVSVVDARMVALGEKLFSDVRLSRDSTVACASCHNLSAAGADGRMHSIGIDGQMGAINAPTVFNATFNFRQFWDGRSASLEEQVTGPITNPIEMGSTWEEVVLRLAGDAAYKAEFNALFPDGVTATNVRKTIAEFERTLVTPNAPFDRFLLGDQGAMNKKAQTGLRLFQEYGCIACHQGRNLGGTMYEKLGIVRPFYGPDRPHKPEDLGRFNLTKEEEHKFEFKVPGLRNVAKTGPYLHDGSVATLDEVVRLMGRYQLGIEFTHTEVQALVAFLESLTGEYNGRPL